MAYVFLGTDLATGDRVVLKTLRGELAASDSVRERIYREALLLARLDHPNVVRILDIFEHQSAVILVLEFVDGGTIEDRILAVRERGPLRASDVRYWSFGLLAGLGELHACSFVHRDVKPSNVLLTQAGVPKMTDLGVTLDASGERARLTRQGSRPGTAQYMAPEQIKGWEITARTDIYAAGLVIYEMLVGDPPFDAASDFELMDLHMKAEPDFARLAASAPAPVVQAIQKSLRKDPAQRFRSTAEFCAAIEAWCP